LRLRDKSSDWRYLARVKVFSFWEILIFVVFILFISYLLYPKGKIVEYFMKDPNYNYPLAKVFLEDIIAHTKDPKLIMALINKNLQAGEFDRAYKLLEKYKEILENAYKDSPNYWNLVLNVYLHEYSFSKGEEKRNLKRQIIRVIDKLISSNKIENIKLAYKASLSIGSLEKAALASVRLAFLTKKKEWIIRAIKLSRH